MNEREIFTAALNHTDPDQRATFLDAACGADAALRERVEALLVHHAQLGSFMASSPTTSLDDSIAERPGAQIGPYRLLQQVGEGGFGVVFMAEQQSPVRRKVALKVIKPGMDTRQVIARFEAERQALAVMDHPNIARVLDAGATPTCRPYFVMELVRGTPITQYCDENSLDIRERLALFATVCQAIQHAHTKGIIHRDIKPTNVLVTRQDGHPMVKVIDFGIAKAMGQQLTEKTLFTDFTQMIGTPLYMSPEQAELSSIDVDTRSDIYSLGVLLYELLTGSTPVSKEQLKQAAFDEIRRIICEDEPPKPSTRISSAEAAPSIAAHRHTEPAKLARLVRGELDWIVMKALDKNRSRRYETATGFAADIYRYLNDEPVLACPPSAAYRFRKFARRHKGGVALAGATAVIVLLALVGLAISNVLITREKNLKVAALRQAKINEQAAKAQEKIAEENAAKAQQQEQIALANERTAQANELLARRRYYAAQMNLAMQAWRVGDRPRVLELLEGQRPQAGDPDLRGFEWHYLWRLCYGEAPVRIAGHRTAVLSLAYSSDGKTLASAGFDGTTRLWNVATGEETAVLRTPGSQFWWVAFSPDGRWLVTSDSSQRLTIWDAQTQQQHHAIPGAIVGISFSPDGKYVAGGLADAAGIHATLWDLDTGAQHIQVSNAGIPLGFLPDGGSLVTMSNQYNSKGKVHWWNLETKEELRSKVVPGINTAIVSPDGTRVAAANYTVFAWDADTGDSIAELHEHSNVRALAFSPDSKLLAVGKEDKTATIWDLETQAPLAHEVHRDHVWATVFSPDGSQLASGTLGGAIKIWDFKLVDEATTLSFAKVHAVQLSLIESKPASADRVKTGSEWMSTSARYGSDHRRWQLPLSDISQVAVRPVTR